ncbi:hypothetical protein E2C01_096728 [Portunus trituberculatus]|uniref:Uncharacterized protein n=1 Tax=Portunus trituberculatus TaxID=210409 RepID=A0A5B7K2I6_PORTR|nr:hypothetical protein [Portunus trituberculatus]
MSRCCFIVGSGQGGSGMGGAGRGREERGVRGRIHQQEILAGLLTSASAIRVLWRHAQDNTRTHVTSRPVRGGAGLEQALGEEAPPPQTRNISPRAVPCLAEPPR